jgi:hypothetical protein
MRQDSTARYADKPVTLKNETGENAIRMYAAHNRSLRRPGVHPPAISARSLTAATLHAFVASCLTAIRIFISICSCGRQEA